MRIKANFVERCWYLTILDHFAIYTHTLILSAAAWISFNVILIVWSLVEVALIIVASKLTFEKYYFLFQAFDFRDN